MALTGGIDDVLRSAFDPGEVSDESVKAAREMIGEMMEAIKGFTQETLLCQMAAVIRHQGNSSFANSCAVEDAFKIHQLVQDRLKKEDS
jgi:hypothetical protein